MARFTEAQKEGRRGEILAAALRCFARNGFHNTTIADVVRDSGVSQGTFYLYFQTKDDVIAALADDRVQGDALINAIAGAEDDPVVGLTVLFDLHGAALADPRRADEQRVAIQGWAEALRNEAIRERLLANNARVQQEIALLIERGQRTGQFRPDAEPQGVARALMALFRGLTLLTAWDGSFDPALTAKAIEDMARGALGPPGGRGDRGPRRSLGGDPMTLTHPATPAAPTARSFRLTMLVPTLLVSVAAPIAIFKGLEAVGVAPVWALMVGCVPPLLNNLRVWIASRRLDPVGILMMASIAGGPVAALISGSIASRIAADCLMSSAWGLAFLGSLLFSRPAPFYLIRALVAGDDASRTGAWNGLWRYAAFRSTLRSITALVGRVPTSPGCSSNWRSPGC